MIVGAVEVELFHFLTVVFLLNAKNTSEKKIRRCFVMPTRSAKVQAVVQDVSFPACCL